MEVKTPQFGRNSKKTELPAGFKSWADLYQTWSQFKLEVGRARNPSVTERFRQRYGNVSEYVIYAIQPLFKAAERGGDIGAYANELIEQVEAGTLGVTKARQMVRSFVTQNPAFRTAQAQQVTIETLASRLHDDVNLAGSLVQIHKGLSTEFLEEHIEKVAKSLKALRRFKGRMDQALIKRKGEG